MKSYILALDQGTTSSRAIIFDKAGRVISLAQKEYEQYYPKPGWVEHDPNEIWYSQASVAAEVLSRADLNGKNISAIGITNQRETTVIWDRETGDAIYNAIVWQDRRVSDFCDKLNAEGHGGMIREKTGLLLDAYFSAPKIKWILDNVEGAREKARQGKLAFGTVDSWLVWKFTNGDRHITDVSNASRTLLFNIHTLEWDEELLKLFDIPRNMLPEVKSSSEIYGETATTIFASKVPIGGVIGDQQAALFGQMCFEPGMIKTTYGTGCFLMMNTGDNVIRSENQMISTIAWKIGEKVTYALEGSVFVGGAVVQWLRDNLSFIEVADEIEDLAQSVEDNGGIYMVPSFAGLGAPHWDQYSRGLIIGITRGTETGHIARAALESIAFQVHDVVQAMQADTGHENINEIRVDGIPSNNKLLMQFQSDISRTTISKPSVYEVTALGAAYIAGLASGYWESIDDIRKNFNVETTYNPQLDLKTVDEMLYFWNKALNRSSKWLKKE
jgi:glycerol kinase